MSKKKKGSWILTAQLMVIWIWNKFRVILFVNHQLQRYLLYILEVFLLYDSLILWLWKDLCPCLLETPVCKAVL